MTIYTASDIQQRLEAEWENDLPDQVLAVFQKHSGKQLSKRILKDLPGGEEKWLIRHNCGMTYLEDRDYLHSQGNKGYHFLLAYSEKNVVIDPIALQEFNSCHFSARKERNNRRLTAKNDQCLLSEMADAINAVSRAKEELAPAERRLAILTEYGEVFSPDRYTWEKMTSPDTK